VCLYIAVGLVILHSRPGHLVGRLCLVGGCIESVGGGLLELSHLRLKEHPADPLAALGAKVGSVVRADGFLLLVLVLPLAFPDGQRGGPRRLVPWAWRIGLITVAVFTLQTLLSPYESDLRMTSVDNPVGLPHSLAPVTDAMAGIALLLAVLTIALAITCVVSRWRYGSELRRQQLLWFGLAFAPPIALFLMSFSDSARPWMFGVALVPFPVAIGFAVLQHRLYDVALASGEPLPDLRHAVVGHRRSVRRDGRRRWRPAHWLPWVAAGVVAVSFRTAAGCVAASGQQTDVRPMVPAGRRARRDRQKAQRRVGRTRSPQDALRRAQPDTRPRLCRDRRR
jgi:hypothetical protein